MKKTKNNFLRFDCFLHKSAKTQKTRVEQYFSKTTKRTSFQQSQNGHPKHKIQNEFKTQNTKLKYEENAS